MKKGVTKSHLSATVDNSTLKKFQEYCYENSINKSDLIEKMIERYLKEKK